MTATGKKQTSKVQTKDSKNIGLLDIIRYPIVTEKSTNLSAHSQVTFAVLKSATKPQIDLCGQPSPGY